MGAPLGERILTGQGPELAELLEAVGESITIRDRDDRYVYANRAALEFLGVTTLEELLRRPVSVLTDRYVVRDAAGQPVTAGDFPSAKLLRGEPVEPLLVQMVDRATGESHWLLLKVSGLRDAAGELAAVVTIIENVTAVKAAEVHTRVLAESGRILAASLDYDQTLRNVAQAAVPALADWCLVELVDDAGRREQVVVAHRDAGQRRLAARMRELEPPDPGGSSAITRVIATGESELYPEVSDERLVHVAHGSEQLDVLRSLEIRSALMVPMRVAGRNIGAMSFFTSRSLRRLTADDLEVAEQLGRRAAVAVENSRLHTSLAAVADTLQQSLKPSPLPDVEGWEIAALYRPAEAAQRIEVGGDFYEVFDAGPAWLALIGDVTGHGVAAATLTALMRHGARFASRLEPAPDAVLRRLDEALRERGGTSLCTALCAGLHERRLVLASAGHPPALHVDRLGEVTELPTPGPLLGAFPDAQWRAEPLEVAPGELVLLYTDGVTETAGASERFGGDRLRRLLSGHAGASPSELLDTLDAELRRFRGGEPTDDVAALALRPRAG